MKVSVCLTVLNAEDQIAVLLESILNQTRKADEIVIVDGGSNDKTLEIIRHFQKKNKEIKLLSEKCYRARGRNLGVEISRNEIIAMTDGGCIARKDWLDNIIDPLEDSDIDIVGGIYEMVGETSMQKALGVFLGFRSSNFGEYFLPTTRSIAFRKKAWEAVGGFPERSGNSAEDTEFNYKALRVGLKYSRVKDAIVEWGIPSNLKEGITTMGDYAEWDARSRIWWHPTQKLASHNIRVISIFFRYIVGLLLLISGIRNPLFLFLLALGFFFYLVWAFRKVFEKHRSLKVAVWGPIIQIASDIAVMSGFLKGTIRK